MQITKEQIRVVTICDQEPEASYYCFEEFKLSLSSQGVYPLVLGKGKGEYNGLASKPKILLNAIRKGWIKEEYTIFCDCFDLVFVAPIEYIIERFLMFNADVVISAEKNCFPETYKNDFDKFWGNKSKYEYKYLNSGFIVARTKDLAVLLESMELDKELDDHLKENGEWFHSNDQELFQKAWTKQRVKISLDTKCELSWCMVDVPMHEIGFCNPPQNLSTGSYPCTIHWNGPAKTQGTMDKILKTLRLRA